MFPHAVDAHHRVSCPADNATIIAEGRNPDGTTGVSRDMLVPQQVAPTSASQEDNEPRAKGSSAVQQVDNLVREEDATAVRDLLKAGGLV